MLSRVSAAETGLTAKTRAELGIDQVLYKQDITLDKLVRLCGRIIEGDQ